MALKGVRVLEFAGLAPGPFCGKILSDFGATVIRVDNVVENDMDVMQHGKSTVAINLKDPRGQNLIRSTIGKFDVLIEPFRPGVMEKLQLGPAELLKINPRLVYARLTGFGQEGRLAKRAGHDINYAAISGVLSMLGGHGQRPTPPINLLADFAGGGLMCALGICLALLERHNSGQGQVVDAAMVDGAAYVATWLYQSRNVGIWSNERGRNLLDGGAYFYNTYETKDGKYMSVGSLEPKFFELFKAGLEMPHLSQFVVNDPEEAEKAREEVRRKFLTKTQAEWSAIFEDIDACVYPVLEWQSVMQHDHVRAREAFQEIDGVPVPKPAPRLSRTPGSTGTPKKQLLFDNLLTELDLNKDELKKLVDDGVILLPAAESKL